MAYVVARPGGRYEIRQSTLTAKGPRSTALATFRLLTDDVLRHAEERAGRALPRPDLVRSARRAGAPVASPEPDDRVGALLGALARGARPTPIRARLAASALLPGAIEPPEDHLRAAGAWAGADAATRGAALESVLSLVDAVPPRRRRGALRFPKLTS
jgi:hypothetical protein